LTAHCTVDGEPFVAQRTDAEGHSGDCTIIDPNTDKRVTVGRSST